MRKWILICFASTAFGLLPPLAQSTRELKELLNDPRLYEALGSAERIQEIIRTERGYMVLTENYVVEVNVLYERGEERIIGPARFELDFQMPTKRGL